MKKTVLYKTLTVASLLLSTMFIAGRSEALQYASIPWNEFLAKSELVAEVNLIKWERLPDYSFQYTFAVNKTYKGPDLETVIYTSSDRMNSIGPVELNCEGIIALRKEGDKWVQAVDGRSWWAYKYELTAELKSIIRVYFPDDLLTDLPPGLNKKKFKLMTILASNAQYLYDAEVYEKTDVQKFMAQQFAK